MVCDWSFLFIFFPWMTSGVSLIFLRISWNMNEVICRSNKCNIIYCDFGSNEIVCDDDRKKNI